MHLIQILLPLKNGQESMGSDHSFATLNQMLVAHFGGVTAYTRAPAKGKWLSQGKEERDDIVVLEVMVEALDREWWSQLRASLEKELSQDEIVIRSIPTDLL